MGQAAIDSGVLADVLSAFLKTGGIARPPEAVPAPVVEKGGCQVPADPGFQVIETHISRVLLLGDFVFKRKKPVALPFLDFSSVAARAAACRREILLNRRTAPQLYRRLLALVQAPDGRLELREDLPGLEEGLKQEQARHAENGPVIIDWIIEMRRFPQSALLPAVAASEGLPRSLMQQLAGEIARFHQQAEVAPASAGGAAAMQAILDGNLACFGRFTPSLFAADRIAALGEATRQLIERHQILLNQRQADGKVRQCHGDLHLGNICLLDGQPVLFDAIEFNDAFAQIDILYDLAFLLMDLDAAGWHVQSSQCLNAWLELTADEDGVPLLPLFLSMRAQIRSHVSAAMAESAANPALLQQKALDYLALAEKYLQPSSARLLAFGGLSGSGKSRAARQVAPVLPFAAGGIVLRSDVLRKRLAGLAPTDRLPPAAYTPESSRQTYTTMLALGRRLLQAGVPVILDAVFAREEERQAAEALAREIPPREPAAFTGPGCPFAGIWLAARPEDAEGRILARRGNASDATPEVLRAQLSFRTGDITWNQIDSSGSKDETDAAVLQALGNFMS